MSPYSQSDISKSKNAGKQGTKRHKSMCSPLNDLLSDTVALRPKDGAITFPSRTFFTHLVGKTVCSNFKLVLPKKSFDFDREREKVDKCPLSKRLFQSL